MNQSNKSIRNSRSIDTRARARHHHAAAIKALSAWEETGKIDHLAKAVGEIAKLYFLEALRASGRRGSPRCPHTR